MSYGIKVSKDVFDVLTTGQNNLILNSDNPLLKIHMKGSGSFDFEVGDSSKTVNIAHGLGYSPLFYVASEYYDQITGEVATGYFEKHALCFYYGLQNSGRYLSYTDATNLTITVTFDVPVANAGTLNYFYIIYADEY